MANLNLDVTGNYKVLIDAFLDPNITGVLLEGASRTAKTWDIIRFLITVCYQYRNHQPLRIDVGRDTLVNFKGLLLPDIEKNLKLLGLYNRNNYHGTDMIYTLYGNTIKYKGFHDVDSSTGGFRDLFWMNESISCQKDVFDELEQRTTMFWILDYNPTRTKHWVYDLEKREDVVIHKTTVFDNPFCPEKPKKKILGYEPTAKNIKLGTANAYKWDVYGLGKRADGEASIFQGKYEIIDAPPKEWDRMVFGLDWGFSEDPNACVQVFRNGNYLILHEILYENQLLNKDIARKIKPAVKRRRVICDSAEPKSIAELRIEHSIDAVACEKGPDSIKYGIKKMQSFKLQVTKSSLNLLTELENYIFTKKKDGTITDVPIDDWNHLIDAARYATMFISKKQKKIV